MALITTFVIAFVPVVAARPLDLAALLNADLLAEAPAQLAPSQLAPALGSPDAVCLRGPGRPDLPLFVDLDVGSPTNALRLTLAAGGSDPAGPRPAAGVALVVTFTYADGTTTRSFAFNGRQLGPGPVEGRLTESLLLGLAADGSPRVGTVWTAPTRAAGSPVSRIRLESRNASIPCVLAAELLTGESTEIPHTTQTDTSDWYPFTISGTLPAALPQLSPIEAPAGKHGFLTRTKDGHFAFSDGTRTRFWGINLVNMPAFPQKEQADNLAAELAKLGFNLVRLHHIDGLGIGGVLNPKRTADPVTWLDPVQIDKLDFFISRLEAHGLYVYAEVATNREFNGQDGVPNPGGVPNGHKLATMWDPAWQRAYLAWFDVFWNRRNPYTGLRYPDDPAIAMVELSNEHSLLMHWGLGLEALPQAQLNVLSARWNGWLRERYPTDEVLATAWSGAPEGARFRGLQPGESLGLSTPDGLGSSGSVARQPAIPGLNDQWPMQRRKDLYAFYASLETGFFDAVIAKARSMGFRVPLVPSIVYDQPILQLLYASYDTTDTHVEWDLINGGAFANTSALARPETFLSWAATAVVGQPMLVSELNHPFPNEFRAEAPLLWATLLSAQDWDAPMWFSWLDSAWTEDDSAVSGSFDYRSNTVALAQMPTASSLFRTYALPTALGYAPYNVDPAVVLSGYLTDQHQRPTQYRPLDLLNLGHVLTHRVRSSFERTPPPGIAAQSIPGVGWWADPGVLVLDRPMVQARVGPGAPDGRSGPPLRDGFGLLEPSGLGVHFENWAAVSLASTDGLPLGQSHHALLSVGTRQENTGQTFGAQGTELVQWGGPPILVEPARGTVWFIWPTRPEVRPLGVRGEQLAAIPVRAARGGEENRRGWVVDLTSVRSPWLVVGDAARAPPGRSGDPQSDRAAAAD